MNIRYDESHGYLDNTPVPEDFFRSVPCTGSTPGNQHQALVVSKSDRTEGVCWECQKEALKALRAKRGGGRPEYQFIDAVEESND